MQLFPDKDVLFVAQFEPRNRPRLVCTVSNILQENETPGINSSIANRVFFNKWHDGLMIDIKDTACMAQFDIACKIGGLPLWITLNHQLKVALTGYGNSIQPRTDFVLTQVERKKSIFQCLLYAKSYQWTQKNDQKNWKIPDTDNAWINTAGKKRNHLDSLDQKILFWARRQKNVTDSPSPTSGATLKVTKTRTQEKDKS